MGPRLAPLRGRGLPFSSSDSGGFAVEPRTTRPVLTENPNDDSIPAAAEARRSAHGTLLGATRGHSLEDKRPPAPPSARGAIAPDEIERSASKIGVGPPEHSHGVDAHLRELERAALHDPVAAGRLVRELLRSERIDLAAVELGAYVGHAASLAALDLPYREIDTSDELRAWAEGLHRFGHAVLLRAAVVAGDLGVARHERAGGGPGPRRALEAARHVSEQPSEENRRAALLVDMSSDPIAGARAATGLWACRAAADDIEAPTFAAHAVTCAAYAVGSVPGVHATIARALIAWTFAGVPVPLTRANKASPIFTSWTLTD